ncbi:Acetyltransferase (GNAT) family protein [Candidatus Izimaplasma bacterium HR1]|jgi:ribosomal protein S18 acetylase RimI-like enzyme|uniref:GNAT family N-acetyltransferase n=1 Tax=Candidatus Izimoplasma sp. HR1 TaxID=1541959 RepID=UPI0004F79F43|nr:Acetyltransferase (GNAT) family protein [Candidatus Izimaplasma bacterium HR1]
MKIIEYRDSYAQQVADMWNKSSSNWGDDQTIQTAEDVIRSETTSGNIKLYLAMDNDIIVGYCSFSLYQHDEGASYLPLLNVIPEYHGKKVGKALILQVIEDAKKSNWSRFDLFTWSGNIKAMPLYKKCGFFWEKLNRDVHLMNFIPYLYQTDAINEYMDKIDCYNDSKRIIDMEQDGIEKNGFEYYRYDYVNNDVSLSCEFEKTGRGMRYLDTPEYTIEMTVENHEVVYNCNYKVDFVVSNKTDKPLAIKIKGNNNKNIEFSMDEDVKVIDNIEFNGQFNVVPTDKEQDKSRTHPVVEANIYINGKHVLFKTGVETKEPVNLRLRVLDYTHVLNKQYSAYLDIENNLDTEEEFTINLPSNFVEFDKNNKIVLKPKEKRSITIKYTLSEFGFYKEKAEVTYSNYKLNKIVYSIFKGAMSSFIGSAEYLYYMVSGNFVTILNTKSNNLAMINSFHENNISALMAPSLGKPYSLEFATAKPEVKIISDNEVKVIYSSNDFKGIQLIINIKHTFGILETYYEIINEGEDRELSLSIPVWYRMKDNVVPYNNKLLSVKGIVEADLGNLDSIKIDENWLFNAKARYGLCWDNSIEMKLSDWKLKFDIADIKIEKNSSFITPKIYSSFVHKDVKDFRAFAGNVTKKRTNSFLELDINNGNPFASDNVEIKVINNKKAPLEGTFTVDSKETNIQESIHATPGSKEIIVDIKEKSVLFKRLVFEKQGATKQTIEDDSLVINNGLLTFKASKDYADSIYSLIFNDNEWLDSNYPTPKERAWWGDFVGGLTTRVSGIQDNSSLKETREVEFVSLKDNFENEWQGIKVSLMIENDPDYKGLVVETYTMTLPGVPVVHSFANIINKTGKLIENKEFSKYNVLKIDDKKEQATIKQGNTSYKLNQVELSLIADKLVLYSSSREYKFGVYNKDNTLLADTQKKYNILFSEKNMTIPDNESKQQAGDFIIFTKEDLTKEALIDLENIKFEV